MLRPRGDSAEDWAASTTEGAGVVATSGADVSDEARSAGEDSDGGGSDEEVGAAVMVVVAKVTVVDAARIGWVADVGDEEDATVGAVSAREEDEGEGEAATTAQVVRSAPCLVSVSVTSDSVLLVTVATEP